MSGRFLATFAWYGSQLQCHAFSGGPFFKPWSRQTASSLSASQASLFALYLQHLFLPCTYLFNSLGYKCKDKNQACLGHSSTHHDGYHLTYNRELINTCYLKELTAEWFHCMGTELVDCPHLNTGTRYNKRDCDQSHLDSLEDSSLLISKSQTNKIQFIEFLRVQINSVPRHKIICPYWPFISLFICQFVTMDRKRLTLLFVFTRPRTAIFKALWYSWSNFGNFIS